jgi:putative ABC transport system permease protein
MYYLLSLKNIWRRKMRSFLSALGILLGVALIVSLASVSDGLDKTRETALSAIGSSIYVVQEGKFGNVFQSEIDSSAADQIAKIPGVKLVSPMTIAMVDMEGYVGTYSFIGNKVFLTGMDPAKEKQANSAFTQVIAGRFLSPGETDGAVLMLSLANKVNKNVGDRVKISDKGVTYEFTVVGIIDTGSGDDDHFVVDIGEFRKITGLSSGVSNMLTVVPEQDGISGEIERKIKLLIPNVDPSYASASLKAFESFTVGLRIATWVIAGISALIGGLGIANAMIMSVVERTKEFGILKAVGWSNKDVMGMVILESVIISSVGAIAGILLGVLVARGILPLIINQFDPSVSFLTMAEAFFFALALGVMGALAPAKRAADMDPVEAFRAK